jgi:uncharacterized membrane protein YedE/YeeE
MGAGLWMLWVAADNSASANRLLLAPNDYASAYLKTLGRAQLGPLTHYLASEQNRSLLETWGVVQIVLGGLFFGLVLFGTRLGKFPLAVALVMLLLVIGERVAIAPGMAMVSQHVDFNPSPSQRAQSASDALNFGYEMAEWGKFALGAVMAVILIWQERRRSVHSRNQVDLIDEADYRHIDR